MDGARAGGRLRARGPTPGDRFLERRVRVWLRGLAG
jgi:hypothetical protein